MLLRIDHPERHSLLGFRHFWAVSRLTGWRPERHCLDCLVGQRERAVRPGMATGAGLVLPDGMAYICGVEQAMTWALNFHLAVRPAPGRVARAVTFNGYVVTVEDAEAMSIPELPDGWRGMGRSFTTCRNYRFGAAYLPPVARRVTRGRSVAEAAA